MKKMKVLWAICLSLIIGIAINVNLTSAEQFDNYTFGEVEVILMDYLNSKGEDIVTDSPEYTDFIIDQYYNQSDEELAERTDYRAITAYMSEYIYQYSLQEMPNIKSDSRNSSSITQTSSFDLGDIKNLTIKEMKEQIAREEAEAEKVAKEKKQSKSTSLASTYNVSAAKSYALTWYNGRNPAFPVYPLDCTNFVSQILFAGGMKMDNTWSADSSYSSPSWRLVPEFHTYWSGLKATGTSVNKSTIISHAKEGDVIQLKQDGATRWGHGLFVYQKANGTLYLSGHTDDILNRNFYNISPAWTQFRIIKM